MEELRRVIFRVLAILETEELLINTIRNEIGEEEANKLRKEIRTMEDTYNKYRIEYYRYNLADSANVSSHKAIKIDPYIAGGFMNGAMGAGAGVVTALDAQKKNDSIDARRVETQMNLNKARANYEAYESRLLKCTDKVMDIIYLSRNTGEIYLNKFKELLNNDAENQHQKYREKRIIFLSSVITSIITAIVVIFSRSIMIALITMIVTDVIISQLLKRIIK